MNILIYNKFPVIRSGLSLIVKNKFKNSQIFFAVSIDELFFLSFKTKFDLVIVDIDYEGIDDFQIIRKFILVFSFESRLMFFLENCTKKFSEKCKSYNVFVLNKNSSEVEIYKKIDECFRDRITNQLSQMLIDEEVKNVSIINKTNILSVRELQCATMMLQGKKNIEIAKLLSLSATTVSTYKNRVLKKTKTKNIVELTRFFN